MSIHRVLVHVDATPTGVARVLTRLKGAIPGQHAESCWDTQPSGAYASTWRAGRAGWDHDQRDRDTKQPASPNAREKNVWSPSTG